MFTKRKKFLVVIGILGKGVTSKNIFIVSLLFSKYVLKFVPLGGHLGFKYLSSPLVFGSLGFKWDSLLEFFYPGGSCCWAWGRSNAYSISVTFRWWFQ